MPRGKKYKNFVSKNPTVFVVSPSHIKIIKEVTDNINQITNFWNPLCHVPQKN
jgi:hypothetical protein